MSRIVIAIAPLVALSLVAGCNVQTKKPQDGDEKVTIDANGDGAVKFDMPFAKGEVSLPSSMMHHGHVDIGGVDLMPGSKLNGFSVFADKGKSNVKVGFTSPEAPAAVRDYYVKAFKDKGVTAAVSGDTVTGTTKDGDAFTINTAADGSGSAGSIDIVSND